MGFPHDKSIASHSARALSFLEAILSRAESVSMRSHPHIHRSLRPTDDRTRDLLTQLGEFSIIVSLTTSNSCNHSRHRFQEHLRRGSHPGITRVMGAKWPRGQEAKNEL